MNWSDGCDGQWMDTVTGCRSGEKSQKWPLLDFGHGDRMIENSLFRALKRTMPLSQIMRVHGWTVQSQKVKWVYIEKVVSFIRVTFRTLP